MKFFKKNINMQQTDTTQSRRFTLGQYVAAVSVMVVSVTALSYAAGIIPKLNPFTKGNVISAQEVNDNFDYVQANLKAMAASMVQIQTTLATLGTQTGGAVNATTGTFSGGINATTGTFSGGVSGTSGNFSGALQATTGTFSGNVTAPNLFGQGQSWQVFAAPNRVLETPYLNSTAKPIQVAVLMQRATGPGGGGASLYIDSVIASIFSHDAYSLGLTLTATVMPGSFYYVTDLKVNGGTSSVIAWRELR